MTPDPVQSVPLAKPAGSTVGVDGVAQTDAQSIWRAGVDAVRPGALIAHAWHNLPPEIAAAPRMLVVGAGKAGAAMAAAVEDRLPTAAGLVNVPEGTARP